MRLRARTHNLDGHVDHALQEVGRRLARSLPRDELFLQLVEVMQDHFVARQADLWVMTGHTMSLRTSVPRREAPPFTMAAAEIGAAVNAATIGNTWSRMWAPALVDEDANVLIVPCVYIGDLLGFLRITRSQGGRPWSSADESALLHLGRQVALALHNSRLHSHLETALGDLQASRARLVSAGDAARRDIERDLHDGAQQRLMALSLDVEVLRRRLRDGSPPDDRNLASLAHGLRDAVDELRRLAHGVYPPALEAGGLDAALRDLAEHSCAVVDVEADLGRHRAEVEAAAYFCASEALANAIKHGGPDVRVAIRASDAGGILTFEVTDDGPGFDLEEKGNGQGLTNMADRIGALGGELTIRSSQSGTHIIARLATTTPAPHAGT